MTDLEKRRKLLVHSVCPWLVVVLIFVKQWSRWSFGFLLLGHLLNHFGNSIFSSLISWNCRLIVNTIMHKMKLASVVTQSICSQAMFFGKEGEVCPLFHHWFCIFDFAQVSQSWWLVEDWVWCHLSLLYYVAILSPSRGCNWTFCAWVFGTMLLTRLRFWLAIFWQPWNWISSA